MKRLACITLSLTLAAGAAAQNQTTPAQARSYIQSAFITGVAHAIVSPDVVLGPQLREKLALPADANSERIYDAMFALTAEKPLSVRLSSPDEAAAIAARAAGRPVYALEGGAVPLLVVYDLERNNIPYVAVLGARVVAGETLPPETVASVAEATALRVADMAPAPARARSAAPAAPSVIRLKPIAFAFNDATLADEAKAALEREPLPKLIAFQEARYVLQGHADRMGNAGYNQRLSERRAEAVRDYLIAKGVPAKHIKVAGLGASMPQTSCKQKQPRSLIDCLAPDRRVTVEIQPPPM